MTDPGGALERRNAALYLVGLTLSAFGSTALILVASVWVKDLTGSTEAATLVSVAVYAPSLLAPVAGLLADRLPPRAVLIGVQVALAPVLLLLLVVRSADDVWLVLVVMALYGASEVVIDPAEVSIFTAMLSDPIRVRVNALRLTLRESGKLVTPLLGAALYAAFGGGAVAAIDAATCLLAAVAVGLLRVRPIPRAATEERWWHAVAAGGRHIARAPGLGRIVLVAAAGMALSAVLLPVQFDLVAALGRPPAFLGVLTAVLGAGSIAAGLISPPLLGRVGPLRTALLGLVLGAAGTALRTTGLLAPALAGSFLLGWWLPLGVLAALTATQDRTPQRLQGRVSALLGLALFAPQPVLQLAGAGLIALLDWRALSAVGVAAQLLILAAAQLVRVPAVSAARKQPEL